MGSVCSKIYSDCETYCVAGRKSSAVKKKNGEGEVEKTTNEAQSSTTSDKKKEKSTAPTQTIKAQNEGIVCAPDLNDVEADNINIKIKSKKTEHAHDPSPYPSDETNDKPKGQNEPDPETSSASVSAVKGGIVYNPHMKGVKAGKINCSVKNETTTHKHAQSPSTSNNKKEKPTAPTRTTKAQKKVSSSDETNDNPKGQNETDPEISSVSASAVNGGIICDPQSKGNKPEDIIYNVENETTAQKHGPTPTACTPQLNTVEAGKIYINIKSKKVEHARVPPPDTSDETNDKPKAHSETDPETSSVSASAVNGGIVPQLKGVKAENIIYNVENETTVLKDAQSLSTSNKKKEKSTAPTQITKAQNEGILCTPQLNDVEADNIQINIKNKKTENSRDPSPDLSDETNDNPKAQNKTGPETESGSAVNGGIICGPQLKGVKAEAISCSVENETTVLKQVSTQTAKPQNGGIVCTPQLKTVEAGDINITIKSKKKEHTHVPSPDSSDERNDNPEGQTQKETQNMTGSSVQNRTAVIIPQSRNDPAKGGPTRTETQDTGSSVQNKTAVPIPQSKNGPAHGGDSNVDGDKDMDPVKISTAIKTLLIRLRLQDNYEQKLTPEEFLKISSLAKQDNICKEDLSRTFLHKLMMLDYRARYISVSAEVSQAISEFDNVENNDSDTNAFWNTKEGFDQLKQNNIHPLDVQMAVFHCSDSFLKQNMITKLSQCQYALPLLVPDPLTPDIECPLWTFRQIQKKWRKTETKNESKNVTIISMPICEAETLMVSFFRLGSLSVSKSQLMNTLINDRYNTFFHRDCPSSTKSRHLFDGVAEIAWYCPAGSPNDTFSDCVAFCNLHGDALMSEMQRNILIQKCSVNVVLVPKLDRKHESSSVISALLESVKPLICLIVDDNCDLMETNPGKYKMGLKDRGLSDVSEKVKTIIRKILSGPHESFQLETMANVCGIRVDEDDELCQKGKSAAMKILNLVQGLDVSNIKDTFLPCQGELWHDWCKINKDLYHLKGDRLEEEMCKKKRELEKIRGNQCTVSSGELMKSFTENLSSLPPTGREYFLKWTQILVDALSTVDFSSVHENYHKKWSEVLSLKNKHDKSDQLKLKQKQLEEISTKLQSATFGLEHIFREMGQIYEAHKCLNKPTLNKQTDWSKYPELAADLMISGYPMELMDGDAGHVPLTWISSLLGEVIKKLGDPRVFVLSVLGLQSSGKSTMLNAMFGLQFAVSAGRCTRGAFMQLVKVSDKKRDFQFDYVLVVDTEGLRGLELEGNSTLQHDNELATFIVGVGNMTLINIFGENPAGMEDVLQIVVQAFMRMKKVDLSPSCVFVHQNVTDVAAVEKNMDGKRRLQEKLDEMARLAAKEEVFEAENFNDIISFEVQKDVKYFAQLWEGSPPMAPPNPGYSESIQDLKSLILIKASQSAGVTLSEFKTKVQDLWNALMNENFVFSFKNTYEIAVYRKLEVQYGKWTWALRSEMLTIENQLHNRIENGKLDQIELSYLYNEMSTKYEEVKATMTSYFEDKDKEILAHWEGQFKIKIEEFHDEQVRKLKRKLDEVIQQKVARKKFDEKKTKFENELLQKSKELAHLTKTKGHKTKDEIELQNQFNCVWKDWVSELTKDIKPIEDIKLEEEQFKILCDLGIESKYINESKTTGSYKKISELGDYTGYVAFNRHQDHRHQQNQENEGENSHFKRFKNMAINVAQTVKTKLTNDQRKFLQHEDQTLIRKVIDDVKMVCLDLIKSKPVATIGYSPTFLQEVAKTVQDKVREFDPLWRYALKKEFTVDLLLHVFDEAESWLLESHKKFRMTNDAHTYLESKKSGYYSVFRSYCKGTSSAVVLGEVICEKLKGSIVEAVCTKTAIDLAGEMRCNFPAFSENRLNLEKHVLKSLAEKENFDDYITYIYQPRRHVESFIKNEVKEYIDHSEKPQNILKKNVDDIKNLISQALFVATENVKTQKGDLEMWLQKFSNLLKDVLTFSSIYSENFNDVNDFDFLKKGTEEKLIPVFEDMKKQSLDKMSEFREQPDQILIKQLCDCCWETCPFCSAVCTNTVKDHSPDKHSVPFHRPSGIQGWHNLDTMELSIYFCTTKVASDHNFHPRPGEEFIPCKMYQTAGGKYETWLITPDGPNLTYWKWFVCQFQKELEEHHQLKFQGSGEIPSDWREYTKEEAIKGLDEMYK